MRELRSAEMNMVSGGIELDINSAGINQNAMVDLDNMCRRDSSDYRPGGISNTAPERGLGLVLPLNPFSLWGHLVPTVIAAVVSLPEIAKGIQGQVNTFVQGGAQWIEAQTAPGIRP